jgi:hypothetical protein
MPVVVPHAVLWIAGLVEETRQLIPVALEAIAWGATSRGADKTLSRRRDLGVGDGTLAPQ